MWLSSRTQRKARLLADVLVRKILFPDIQEQELTERMQQFHAIVGKVNQEMSGGGQDYQQGYVIGAYLHDQEEDDYSLKDLDQLAEELLAEYDVEPPIQDVIRNVEAFKEGLMVGYGQQGSVFEANHEVD